ncbi:MAG TPA: CAP domain-containing protein [Roseiflexaceae bacterium]|nr:CAP domain-containing protein [Roseiflexaceae bacterium]
MKPAAALVCHLALAVLLSGCGGTSQQSQRPSPVATPTARPATPTITPTPTSTAIPTATLTPTATPTVTPLPENADAAAREAALLEAVNRLRAENGLPPYRPLAELSAVARAHSCELAALRVISHTSADGRTVAQRMPPHDPPLSWPSESIAAGFVEPDRVIALWMDEPPEGWHRRNLLDPDKQVVGIGYCYTADDPTGNEHYWTMDIAQLGTGG